MPIHKKQLFLLISTGGTLLGALGSGVAATVMLAFRLAKLAAAPSNSPTAKAILLNQGYYGRELPWIVTLACLSITLFAATVILILIYIRSIIVSAKQLQLVEVDGDDEVEVIGTMELEEEASDTTDRRAANATT